MSGSIELAGGLSLTMNRLVIVIFALAVFAMLELGGREVKKIYETALPKEASLETLPRALADWIEESLFEASSDETHPLPEGQAQTRALTDFYLGNAKLIREAVTKLGLTCIGGDNAPYIWINTGRDSWEFFDRLLSQAQVVTTPGAGFGRCGEGHVRISAFNSRENVTTALARIAAALR